MRSGSRHLVLTVEDNVDGENPDQSGFTPGTNFFRILVKGSGRINLSGSGARPVIPSDYGLVAGPRYRPFDNECSVSSPATSRNVIAVGAYTNATSYVAYDGSNTSLYSSGTVGALADFSSIGPSTDGRLKPEVVAPGEGVISALSSYLMQDFDPRYSWLELADGGRHVVFSGTSMAAPVATGAVALYLEKYPVASYQQVKEAIISGARRDQQTAMFGPLPNNHWGYGKLDIYRTINETPLTDIAAHGLSLAPTRPNPMVEDAVIAFTTETSARVRAEIYDLLGKSVLVVLDGWVVAGAHQVPLDSRGFSTGAYTLRLTSSGTTITERLVVVH